MSASSLCLTRTSLGKKYLMGLTGLAWAGFVLSHMLGNLLIFVSAEAYNKYSHALVKNPLLPVAEIGLVLLLLAHVFTALKLTIENRRARPQGYAVAATGPKRAAASSRTMAFTGSFILVFVVLHIATFKYGTHYDVTYDGVAMRDIHRLIVEVFQSPGYVAWYLVCLVLLGFHLSHGFSAAFQSLGLSHPRYRCLADRIGVVYALVVAAGFIAQPIYVYLVAR